MNTWLQVLLEEPIPASSLQRLDPTPLVGNTATVELVHEQASGPVSTGEGLRGAGAEGPGAVGAEGPRAAGAEGPEVES